ncbi:SMP-30/gluconolactonase/LRE family protein [Serratia sp. TSA_130.2]|uniref:SMP-30/gluconolactonase/LRE family protein n=1 Tax=Serratia TaxID=613 RepID=UPI000B5F7DA3|nr:MULTISPECIES: SMP-30/gluconolactonase/LRE family protein [Serratia]ASM00913.1 gluconolaconase [Serratia marcescens]EMB2737069.1 SMP-30/gluconolactonase/LRE family protein [Serratia marcescens]MBH1923359.1 SMP-30/gluconolactonase/LRE family protein [Serratia ureilytica]MBH2541142.1 SMP-30/gluconolactonase/LRE family protein [Serratia ureilytica]MBH2849306.1 SMP-30/gluconolactonase/LRE family protein [Serratia marcescens]
MFSIAADVRNTLGECPLWCERTRRLFWTDIEGSELLALEKDKNVVMRWSLPERLGSFALTEKADVLLMGLASRLGLYNLNTQVFSTVSASPGVSGTRIGDGRCDRSGNFLFGTMDDNHPPKVIGQFHRLNAATLTVETLSLTEVAIPNSICFSPDGGTMYYCDSMQGRIFCCDYPTLDNQRVFTETEGKGAPDGSCVDAMGYLWNAEWGGNRVVRYCPDGTLDRILPSPGIQTTCPTLGGEAFTTLYCTSASIALSTPSKYDGALLKAEPAVFAGLPESRFAAVTYQQH